MLKELSPREKICLSWAARGKSSWDIGRIIGISENTVNFHIKNALRKLGVRSRTVAVIKAVRLGFIETPSEVFGESVFGPDTEREGLHGAESRYSSPKNGGLATMPCAPVKTAFCPRGPPAPQAHVRIIPFFTTSGGRERDDLAILISRRIAHALGRFDWLSVIELQFGNGSESPKNDCAVARKNPSHEYAIDGVIVTKRVIDDLHVRILDLVNNRLVASNRFSLHRNLEMTVAMRVVEQIERHLIMATQ